MTSIKLVVSDVDGTLLTRDKRITDAAKRKGIPVVTVKLERERARLWALRDNNPYGEWEEQALAADKFALWCLCEVRFQPAAGDRSGRRFRNWCRDQGRCSDHLLWS